MVEKSVKNYIEWSSQRTKRLDFGPCYDPYAAAVTTATAATTATTTAATATATTTATTARLCVRLRLWRELLAHCFLFNFLRAYFFDIVIFDDL